MNTINNLFSNELSRALGWTLVHSLWQSLIIFLLVIIILRILPSRHSTLRYGITCTALMLAFLFSIATFVVLVNQPSQAAYVSQEPVVIASAGNPETQVTTGHTLTLILAWIEAYMPLIIAAWAIGFMIFLLRLTSGMMYMHRLRTSLIPVNNQWLDYIRGFNLKMGITRLVELAESVEISTPMVIGYVRPVILIPVGMLSGLSTEQLETILVHELAHIKRNDFLVNLIQSFLETVFFFNPLIWALSDLVRKEREFCCDDIVLHQHGGKRAYADALAQLEEARLSKNVFVLSLAQSKYELLNRIKRIMEKSVKDQSGKDRLIIPAVLLVAGLICASWLTIGQSKKYQAKSTVVQDTAARQKDEKPASSYKRSVITTDENGQRHQEIAEEFNGDENLLPFMELEAGRDAFLFGPPMQMLSDTLPGRRFNWHDAHKWDEFSKEFQEKFSEKFEDFYKQHAHDIEKIMEEFEGKFHADELQSLEIPFEELEHLELNLDHLEGMRENMLEDFDVHEQLEGLHENLEIIEEELEHLKWDDSNFQFHTQKYRNFEKDLEKMLRKDGYLSEDEAMQTIEWNNGTLKVNGEKIKDADSEKYQQLLREQYPSNHGNLRKIE